MHFRHFFYFEYYEFKTKIDNTSKYCYMPRLYGILYDKKMSLKKLGQWESLAT